MKRTVARGPLSWASIPAGGEDPRIDALLAAVLFAATVLYLAALPLNLGAPDEAHSLLAAKRVAAGEMLYRDVFDLTTPGWVYLMAGLLSLFGSTLATARVAVAVIHAATAVLMFGACRRLGVRRGLAWAAGLTYLVVCQPRFPIASYHWLATCLSILLLVLCLRPSDTPARLFGLGTVVGLLIAVHQQRGFVLGLGVAALVVALALLRVRYGGRFDAATLSRQLAALAAGALVIVAPMLTASVAGAGVQPVWDALIVFPLVSYRTAHRAMHYGFDFAAGRHGGSVVAMFLRCLPSAAAISGVSVLALAWQARERARARSLTVLAVLGGFAVASIMYYPDVTHIAFIAPFFLIALAELVEWALRLLPPKVGGGLGAGIAGVIVLAGGLQLHSAAVRLRQRYPLAYESAFGRIDLANTLQMHLWEQLRGVLDTTPTRTLYSYPTANYVHLLVGAQNATRFAFVFPSTALSPPEHIREIVETLAVKRVPYVVASPDVARADNPIARYIREHYEKARVPKPLASVLWQRKDDAAVSGNGGG